MNWSVIEDTTLRKYFPSILSILLILIVILDLIYPDRVRVHWQMVALIGILSALPFVPLIKRVSYGELEVGLGKQVKEAEETVEEDMPVPDGIKTSEYLPDEIPQKIHDLYDISHIAAVAMLRTEFEVALRDIADTEDQDHPILFGDMIGKLKYNDKLSQETVNAIMDVKLLTDKAIHEKNLTPREARDIIDVGISALERIYYYKSEGEIKD